MRGVRAGRWQACRVLGQQPISWTGPFPARRATGNNAPAWRGVHGPLLRNGFSDKYREVAMYLDLKDYKVPEDFEKDGKKLLGENVYRPLRCVASVRFDRMCDRVGSVRRRCFREETAKTRGDPGGDARQASSASPARWTSRKAAGWFSGLCTRCLKSGASRPCVQPADANSSPKARCFPRCSPGTATTRSGSTRKPAFASRAGLS